VIADAVLTPAELPSLSERDLRYTTCVVIDVLRATSSMITALTNGALEILPVAEIPEALAMKQKFPDFLLAGERHGVRIQKNLTGSIDFDLGNSPREFTATNVAGRSIIWTTTNGTRALRACANAESVVLASLINLDTVVDHLQKTMPPHLIFVCAGTIEAAAFEDIYTAGALIGGLISRGLDIECRDAAQVVWRSFRDTGHDRNALIQSSSNARKLLANPDLIADVAICLSPSTVRLNALMGRDGRVFAAR
jgi:2-phosphosulfolactate phosphatase